MKSLLTNVASGVKEKIRLTIEYILIGIVLVLGGFAIQLWAQKKNVDMSLAHVQAQLTVSNERIETLNTSLKNVEAVNKRQENTIAQLQKLRKLDSEQLEALNRSLKAAERDYARSKQQLAALRKDDPDVEKYLSTPVPPTLRSLLNSQRAEGAASNH